MDFKEMLTGFFTPNAIGMIVAGGAVAMIIGIAKIVYTVLSVKYGKKCVRNKKDVE